MLTDVSTVLSEYAKLHDRESLLHLNMWWEDKGGTAWEVRKTLQIYVLILTFEQTKLRLETKLTSKILLA